MGTKTVQVGELILDYNLWPRHEANGVDSTNVSRMRDAIRSGVKLPPIIVNSADMRVIDGFHRTKAYIKELGDDAKIRVDMQVYESEADMFADSVRYNSIHGLPMSPKDRAHAILKARRYGIPMSAMAQALGMTEGKMKEFLAKRTATAPSGEVIAIPGGAAALAGKNLTDEEMHYVNHESGHVPMMHASMLINALRCISLPLSENALAKLSELRDMIDEVLS